MAGALPKTLQRRNYRIAKTARETRNLIVVNNGETARPERIACKFHRLPAAALDKLQRYTFKLAAVRW